MMYQLTERNLVTTVLKIRRGLTMVFVPSSINYSAYSIHARSTSAIPRSVKLDPECRSRLAAALD